MSLKQFVDKRSHKSFETHPMVQNSGGSIFDNSYDHHNYGSHDIFQGMEHISVLDSAKLKNPLGRQCVAGDWATVHWKTFDNKHDVKLEDSHVYRKG